MKIKKFNIPVQYRRFTKKKIKNKPANNVVFHFGKLFAGFLIFYKNFHNPY